MRGSKGDKGIQGSPGNSNAHLMWKGVGVSTDTTGQKMLKTDALSSWTNGYAYTKLSYANGCSLSFVPGPVKRNFMMGLASSPGKMGTSYKQIEFGFNLVSDGRLQVYEKGSFRGDYGTYTESSILTITYDGSFVRYYIDGKFLRGLGKYSSKVFSAQVAIHTGNAVVTSAISFNASGQTGPKGDKGDTGSAGAKGALGSKGDKGATGSKGAPGATGLRGLKGTKGDKGAKGDSGVFNGGTISNSTTINSTSDQKLILQGTNNPYIRWKEGTTDRAYIQWHSSRDEILLANQQFDSSLRVKQHGAYVYTKTGWMNMGSHNTSWAHFHTDRPRYYFNKGVSVHGDIQDYATGKKYFHGGNLSAVTIGNNTSLNSDNRNTRGVTRLYRRESNSDYSVQTYWAGSGLNKHLWRLHGYSGDSSHAGCQVEYADQAGVAKKTNGMPSVTNPVNNNLIASGSSSKKSTVDITKYGISQDSGARWGIFTTNMAGGSWPNHQVWVYSTTNWTKGNLVAANHSDKSQHNTFQYMAPIVNNRYCYIYNIESSHDAWSTYFMGVI